jgi:hypothetical protein
LIFNHYNSANIRQGRTGLKVTYTLAYYGGHQLTVFRPRAVAALTKRCVSQMFIGQMSVGQMSINQMSIGQMSIGQLYIGKMYIGQMTQSQGISAK